jgi:hypothetical protein
LAAPFQATVRITDAEDLRFTISWTQSDGTAFPFDDYEIEYSVSLDGETEFTLYQIGGSSPDEDGITVDEDAGTVTFFKAVGTLEPGNYQHNCRLKDPDTGAYSAVFDGPVIVTFGGF